MHTWYGGEMKKGMFSMMNYYLPLNGMASMHCSANTDMNGENTALFFGLSGTGKTTLSTDPKRLLIGDDEHGWDDEGVFNFEGGCYAKVINLDKDAEPDIYNAIKRNALLENVTVDKDGKIDFADKSVTENTRVSYPIDHIEKIVRPVSAAPAAKNVIFLSADAFGVLPPVSILTPEQTEYYFLSGFTAKLAGTERGITEPTPTFSACFGQAFLELHPTKYQPFRVLFCGGTFRHSKFFVWSQNVHHAGIICRRRTYGQFQTVAEIPFILGIEAKLVKGDLGIGVGHTVEAISQSE